MNPVVHFEIPYKDKARIAAFYQQAFGWQMQMLGPEMGEYVVATTTPSGPAGPTTPGAINGGFFQTKPDWPDQYPSVVVAIENMAQAIAQVHAAGGKVLGEPMDIPGVGKYVAFHDSEGNRVSMLQYLPRQV